MYKVNRILIYMIGVVSHWEEIRLIRMILIVILQII